jgi:K+-transporting ATPase A subunit
MEQNIHLFSLAVHPKRRSSEIVLFLKQIGVILVVYMDSHLARQQFGSNKNMFDDLERYLFIIIENTCSKGRYLKSILMVNAPKLVLIYLLSKLTIFLPKINLDS